MDDGTEIIIGSDYHYDRETDEEESIEHEGFTNLGDISLSVWRWQCADIETLKKYDEELPEWKDDFQIEVDYKDMVMANVKPGKWDIEHYFDLQSDKEMKGVYSRLKLKE